MEQVLDRIPGYRAMGDKKYKNSSMTEFEVEQTHKEILAYMASAKPYFDPDLTINQLADQVQLPARDLSRVINERVGKNFMEFINHYRIEEAKRRLLSGEDVTVLDLAMDVGFNSKSAFYDAFKRVTKTTPTRFKKEYV